MSDFTWRLCGWRDSLRLFYKALPIFHRELSTAAVRSLFDKYHKRSAALAQVRQSYAFEGGEYGRSLISRTDGGVFRVERGAGLCLGKTAEAAMSWLYILSGVLALAIFVYLIIALLFPEKF
jgi:K+-transporting ATPase KdpF subunit